MLTTGVSWWPQVGGQRVAQRPRISLALDPALGLRGRFGPWLLRGKCHAAVCVHRSQEEPGGALQWRGCGTDTVPAHHREGRMGTCSAGSSWGQLSGMQWGHGRLRDPRERRCRHSKMMPCQAVLEAVPRLWERKGAGPPAAWTAG